MIVTDQRLADIGIADSIAVSLAAAGIDPPVYPGGEAEPTLEAAERTIAFAAAASPMEFSASAAAATWTWPKSQPRYWPTAARRAITSAMIASTGRFCRLFACRPPRALAAKCRASCVLTDRQAQVKVGVLSNYLRPRLAIVDPLLTFELPGESHGR